jgi:hypothetical protein
MEATSHDWTQSHLQRAGQSLESLKTPDFCASCHQQFVPGTGIVAIDTLGEWHRSGYAAGTQPTTCVDCHMPDQGGGTRDHSIPGGNVYIAQTFGETDFAATVGKKLSSAIQLSASAAADGVHVLVMNTGAGHSFPTGVTDIREPWVEVQALDGNGALLATYGGPDSTGLVPLAAARLGMDIASSDGTLLYSHELTQATRIPFEHVVPAQGSLELRVPIPTNLPPTAVELDAVLLYRNVRTPYYQAATGGTGHAPDVEVARAAVGR